MEAKWRLGLASKWPGRLILQPWCAWSDASGPLKLPARQGSACRVLTASSGGCLWTSKVATAVMLYAGALCMVIEPMA